MTGHVIALQVRRLDGIQVIETKRVSWHVDRLWYLTCSCGWTSAERPDDALLHLDRHRHLVAVGERVQRRSTRPRDGRKTKVYAAERAAFPDIGKQAFASSAVAQALLNEWMETAWWKARFSDAPIQVISRTNGSSTGSRGTRTINLNRSHWNRYVLAHEAAHVLQPSGTAGHGKEWCGIYVALVARFIGDAEADALRREFIARKIPHRFAVKPTRTVVTKAARSAETKRQRDLDARRLLAQSGLAADVIRAAVADGRFGPAGTKLRRSALDVARQLDGPR